MAQSEPSPASTSMEAVPKIPKTRLIGLTIFIDEKRIAYRPFLSPGLKAKDLAIEIFWMLKHIRRDGNYQAKDLKELMREAKDASVLVRLEGPPGFYIRTLSDVEDDAALWEEILNYEFPGRHQVTAKRTEAGSTKRSREEGREIEMPSSKRVC